MAAQLPTVAALATRSVVGLALTLLLLVISLALYLSVTGGSVEYRVVPTERAVRGVGVEVGALARMNQRVGCELWGQPVKHEGRPALRFRFPSELDEDLAGCVSAAMPEHYRLESASWLATKWHGLWR